MADHFILSHVRHLPLFAYLSPEQVDTLANAFHQARYAANTVLCRQGEIAGALYIFVSGNASVLQTGADGIERTVRELQPGDSLGEEGLFLTEHCTSTVVTTQESIALVLTRPDFEAVLKARPDIRPQLNMQKELLTSRQQLEERGIRTDEVTLLLTRRHPWAFAGREVSVVVLFVILIGVAIGFSQVQSLTPGLPLICLGLALFLPGLLAVYYFFEWRNDYYTITNQRVIHEERYLLTGQEYREQALLTSVQSVNVSRRGPIAEVIGFGDVIVNTMGHQQPLVLDMVPTPLRVQQIIFEQLQRRNPDSHPAPAPPTDPPPAYPSRHPPGFFSQLLELLWPRTKVVDGDRITYRTHRLFLIRNLWKPVLSYLLLAVLVVLRLLRVSVILQNVPGPIMWGGALIWLVLNTFWSYWQYADWYGNLYIIDSQSILDIRRRPLWIRETRVQAGLQQVQNVTSEITSAWGRLFNYGNVIIQTAAEHGAMIFAGVPEPTAIADEVLRRVQRYAAVQAKPGQAQPPQPVAYNPPPAYEAPPPAERTQPIWRTPRVPAMPPQGPPPTPSSTPSPTTASVPPPMPTMPGPIPEMPQDMDQTQARTPASDTQPIKPPPNKPD